MKSNIFLTLCVVLVIVVLMVLPSQASEGYPWDGSILYASATCSDGEITFMNLNAGKDMDGPVEWRFKGFDAIGKVKQYSSGVIRLKSGEGIELSFPLLSVVHEYKLNQRPGYEGVPVIRIVLDKNCVPATLINTPTSTPATVPTSTPVPTVVDRRVLLPYVAR